MQLNNFILFVLIILCNCSPKIKPAAASKISINVEDSQAVKFVLSDFLLLSPVTKNIQLSEHLIYKTPPFTILYIDGEPYYLLQPDEIIVNKKKDQTSIAFKNKANNQFNLFFRDFKNGRAAITNRQPFFVNDNKDSIIENYFFIERYAEKFDKELNELIDSLALKYQIDNNITVSFKHSELTSKKIIISYATVRSFFPELKDKNLLVPRLLWYLNRINTADKQTFLTNRLYIQLFEITRLITGRSIRLDETPTQIIEHITFLKNYLKPKDPCFQYLITVLYTHAKNKRISFASPGMKELKKLARRSAYRNLFKASLFNHKRDYLENDPDDQNYFDENGNKNTLSSILEQYDNKPVILDFWATWCNPCIANISENKEYLKKFPSLNIVMISVDKNNYNWKDYLGKHDLSAFTHFRSNVGNKDSLQFKVNEIPKYGLVFPNQNGIELYEELTEKIIIEYLEKFESLKQ